MMERLIQKLCQYGSVSFDRSKIGITVIFEPHAGSVLPGHMRSTVQIKRQSPSKALAALEYYITTNKHWSEYPSSFFKGER